VELAICQDDPDSDDRKSEEPALLERGLETLVAGGDVLSRNAAAFDGVNKLVNFFGQGL